MLFIYFRDREWWLNERIKEPGLDGFIKHYKQYLQQENNGVCESSNHILRQNKLCLYACMHGCMYVCVCMYDYVCVHICI